LNNSGKIKNLNLRAVVQYLSGNGRQRRELVRRRCCKNPSMSVTPILPSLSIPSECCPVNLLINVLFPTDGNPMKPLFQS
jgi:hypothetical protein